MDDVTEGYDRQLPELHDRDPRLCPGRVWLPSEQPPDKPFLEPHEFEPGDRCWRCYASKDDVRARFSDWRYEQVIIENTRSLDRLAVAIRAGRLA